MLLALSAGQKIGLAAVAGTFIGFALLSSIWLSRRYPTYPGRHLRLFVLGVVCLTVGTLLAVIFVATEEHETKGATKTEQTTTGPAPPPPAAPKGNPVAGKPIFAAQGCASCHTFGPAGSNGTVGPNLDNLAADAQKAGRGSVEEYARESIVDPDAYAAPGTQKGLMPKDFGQKLSKPELDDLVAFLTQS